MEKTKYLPLGLIVLYTIKMLAFGAQVPDSVIFLGLVALQSVFTIKIKDSQFKKLEGKLESYSKELKEKTAAFEAITSKVSTMQLASGIKQYNNRGQ
jgi:hypothetical protein